MSNLTARPTLRYYADRLRTTLAEPELVGESDLLTFLSDGYKRLCERSGCLLGTTTVTLTSGVAEADLPEDHYRTRLVALGGVRLDELSLRNSLASYGAGVPLAYYQYAGKIGFAPTPNTSTNHVTLLYSASPPPVQGYDDDLDPRLPPEYRYGIVHWVRWRITQIDGGAQGISRANYERALFEDCVGKIRRQLGTVASVTPGRMRSVVEAGRALR